MSGVETVLILVAGGSVITATIYAIKKGVVKCKCCGFECVQNQNAVPESDSGRGDMQKALSMVVDTFNKKVNEERRKSLDVTNAGALAVQSSQNTQKQIENSNDFSLQIPKQKDNFLQVSSYSSSSEKS